MSSINYSPPGTRSSASEVLNAVVTELGELHARYTVVTKRIRVLRGAIEALLELRSRSVDQSSEQAWSLNSPARTEAYGPRDVGARCVIARKKKALPNENPGLQRACRIALTETTVAAVCDDEIYARIVRRGSFSFASAQSAAHAIARELTVMADQGEVEIVFHPSKRLWRRIPPDPAPRNPE